MENEFLDKDQITEKEAASKQSKKKKAKSEKRGPSAFVQILNGDFLSKEFIVTNLNFLFFLMFLLLLIIGKGYYGKKLSDEIAKNQKDLDQINTEFVEAKAKLEEDTRRIKLVKELESSGLKETEIPTKVIKIKKEQ